MSAYYNTSQLNIRDTLAVNKKDQWSNIIWQTLFKHLIEKKYPGYHQIYTDGSHKDNKSAAACWNSSFQLKCRLEDGTSIFTTELYAIYTAINFIKQRIFGGKYLILSDSLSAINALKSNNLSSHFLLPKIATLLHSLEPTEVIIEWVPSHMGIAGNESADKLANETTQFDLITKLQYPTRKSYQLIRAASSEEWKRVWRGRDPSEITFKPTPAPTAYSDLPRKDQVILSRIRLQVTKLTHAHHFKKKNPRQCDACNTRLTLHHLFIECPNLANQRKEIVAHCRKENTPLTVEDITSPPFPAHLIIKFLKDAQAYKEI